MSSDYDLTWTNCFLFLIGLNELKDKKSDKKKDVLINYGFKIIRLILIPLYIHLTAQMFGLAVMGIYLKHNRLPILIWYYYALVQGISAIQWYLMMERKERNNAQLHLMTRVITTKRRKFIKILDLFVSGILFICFLFFMIFLPLFILLTKNLDSLIKWFISKNSENSAAYVHKFVIPCSEISAIAVLISSKLSVSFFHIHLYHVAQTLREKITGLNGENKERLIKRFLEWIARRGEAIERFSPLIFCWSLNLVINFMARTFDGFDKTPRPDLLPLKLLVLLTLFLFYGYCSSLSQSSFKEAHGAAVKYLINKENNNKVPYNKYNQPENELLQQLTQEVIEPSYILSIFKCKLFEINNNLPFKLFMAFLILHLIPSMFSFK